MIEEDAPPLVSSDGGQMASPPGALGFAELNTTVFQKSCGSSFCHEGNPPSMAPMSLDAAHAYSALVGKPSSQVPSMLRVAPGDPSKSYLLYKLKGTSGTVGASTKRMPLNKAPLDPAHIAEIEAWIKRGAPND
ncbi:MAG: hypothetical protein ACT4TC_04195 [Myxococcaceae bacterium]